MVKPLFNAALVLCEYEPSKTHVESLEKAWRGTFKSFMMISSITPNELVNEMINSNLQTTASTLVQECKTQWEQRKNQQAVHPKKKSEKGLNLLRGVSNKWCDMINFQSNLCSKCLPNKEICNSTHLKIRHGITMKDIKKIWEEDICPITRKAGKKSRDKVSLMLQKALRKHILDMESAKIKLSKTNQHTQDK